MRQTVLQHRRQVQLQQRRARRRNDPKLHCLSDIKHGVTIEPTSMADLAAITSRLGK